MDNSGVLLVAHTSPAYVAEAVAMAWSIRRNSPGLPIALATDVEPLEVPEGLFDQIVRYDFNGKGGVSFKIWLDEISPWERTLFLDSDAFVYRPLQPVLEALEGRDFAALGETVSWVGHWFQDPQRILKEFSMDSMTVLIGDFYCFNRSSKTQMLFRKARELFARYDDLGMVRLHGGFNEEPIFSLAMHCEGIPIVPRRLDWVCALEFEKGFSNLKTNVLEGQAVVNARGTSANPVMVHYGSYRSQALYFRDRCRVNRALEQKAPLGDWKAEQAARWASFRFRARRKLRRWLS